MCNICMIARKYSVVPQEVLQRVTQVRNESLDECKPTSPQPTTTPIDLFGDLWGPRARPDSPSSGDTMQNRRRRMAKESTPISQHSIISYCVASVCENMHFLWQAPRNQSCCTGDRTVHNGHKESSKCRLEDDLCLPCDELCAGGCSWLGPDHCFECKFARLYISSTRVLHFSFTFSNF